MNVSSKMRSPVVLRGAPDLGEQTEDGLEGGVRGAVEMRGHQGPGRPPRSLKESSRLLEWGHLCRSGQGLSCVAVSLVRGATG